MGEQGKPLPERVIQKERRSPYTGERRTIMEDEAFRERLDYLRGLSNKLNKTLQRKLEAADLPYYSWNKSSGEARREKQPGVVYPMVRFLFGHLGGPKQHGQLVAFIGDLIPNLAQPRHAKDKALIEQQIKAGDMDGLADYVIRRIYPPADEKLQAPQLVRMWTDFFKEAYTISSREEAQRYFSRVEMQVIPTPPVVRNLAKIALVSVLEHHVQNMIIQGITFSDARNVLQGVADQCLNIEFEYAGVIKKLRTFIPDTASYARQTIQQIIKVYKPRILGWA